MDNGVPIAAVPSAARRPADWRNCTVKAGAPVGTVAAMGNAHLLRSTLDELDDFVDQLRRHGPGGAEATTNARPPRLVIDEGRAAAEWTLDVDIGGCVRHIGLLVVCDVAADRMTDARLYIAPSPKREE
jgi:hypothetical protein